MSQLADSTLSAARTSPKIDMRPPPRLARGLTSLWHRRPKEGASNARRAAILAAMWAGQAAAAGLVPGFTELSWIGGFGHDAAQMCKLRSQVREEFYAYSASRFVDEKFPTMVEAS